jgi:hypothetical protein
VRVRRPRLATPPMQGPSPKAKTFTPQSALASSPWPLRALPGGRLSPTCIRPVYHPNPFFGGLTPCGAVAYHYLTTSIPLAPPFLPSLLHPLSSKLRLILHQN